MTHQLLSVSFTIYFTANLIINGKTVNSTNVFYNCVDFLAQGTATFEISCSSTAMIVVESAFIGSTDKYTVASDGSTGCPITNNTCTKNVTFPAELCTGLSRCDIAQRLLFPNESNFYCSLANNNNQGANFINVNYSCITPNTSGSSIFGDICQLEGTFVANNTAYISSYPNFPSGIPPSDAFQCSCTIQLQLLPLTTLDINFILLKLSGIDSSCVEQVSVSLGNNTSRIFCSPTAIMNDVITVHLSSNVTIRFDRKSHVSAGTTKFLLELKARNITTGSPVAKISCRFISYPGYPLLNYTSTVKPSTGLSTPTNVSTTSYTSETLANTGPLHSATTTDLVIQTSTNSSTTQGSLLLNTTTVGHANWSQAVINSPAESILSSGAIAGIVVGSVAAVALILVVAILIVKKRQHIQNQKKLAMGNFLSIYRSVDVNSEQTNRTSVTTNNTSPYMYEDADTVLNANASLRNGAIVEHSTLATVPSKSVYERAQMVNGAAVNAIANSVPVVHSQPMKSKNSEKVRSIQESPSGGDGQAAAEGGRQHSNDRQDFAYEQVVADKLTPAEVGHLAFIANGEDVIVIDNQLYGRDSRSTPTVSVPIAPTIIEHEHNGNENERHLDQSNVDQRRSQTDSVYDNARLKSHAPVYYNVLPIENASGVNQPSEEEISNGANQSRDPNDVRKSGVTLIDNTLYGSLLSFAPRSNT